MEMLYLITGLIVGGLYLLFAIVNIFFEVTESDAFTYGLLYSGESIKDDVFIIAILNLLVSMLIAFIWPIIVFGIIIWLLSKLMIDDDLDFSETEGI